MEHDFGNSGPVHPQRCTNVTIGYRVTVTYRVTIDVTVAVAINVSIAVSIRVTFSVDVKSVITISERYEFYVNFRFAIIDIR